MNRLAALSTIALCAGLVAACSKPAGGAASSAAGTPAASKAADGNAVIDVTQAPRPRPGVWAMTSPDGGEAMRNCVPDRPFDLGKIKTMCQSFVFHRTLTGMAVDSTCGMHGVATTMHMTVQGDFQTAYSTDMKMTIAIPGQPARTITDHSDFKYVGPCSAAEQAEANRNAAEAQAVLNRAGAGHSGE